MAVRVVEVVLPNNAVALVQATDLDEDERVADGGQVAEKVGRYGQLAENAAAVPDPRGYSIRAHSVEPLIELLFIGPISGIITWRLASLIGKLIHRCR